MRATRSKRIFATSRLPTKSAQFPEHGYAGYNDAIGWAQLSHVEQGAVTRDFLDDEEQPASARNIGRLPLEQDQRIERWMDAAACFEEHEEQFDAAETGLLWLLARR